MVAAGFGGYGGEYAGLVDLTQMGALVTVPTSVRPRTSPRRPLLYETPGGFLLSRGGANPGMGQALRTYRRVWSHLGLPVILSLAAEGVRDWTQLAHWAQDISMIQGLELEITEEMEPTASLRAVRQACDLPLLAKLPLARAIEMAVECHVAGVDAVVVGLPPRADHVEVNQAGEPQVWKGRWYGPGLVSLALRAVRKVREAIPDLPLIACGGIHSAEEAHAFLALGAVAVQLDSVLWLDPRRANAIAAALAAKE